MRNNKLQLLYKAYDVPGTPPWLASHTLQMRILRYKGQGHWVIYKRSVNFLCPGILLDAAQAEVKSIDFGTKLLGSIIKYVISG